MKRIPLTRGKYATVDDDLYHYLCKMRPWKALKVGKTFYAYSWRHGYMHRVIIQYVNRRQFSRVDHRDRNGLNNRHCNLRAATQQQNGGNRDLNRNNTSGYKGVALCRKSGLWRAQIAIHGKQHHLGYFRYKKHAALAYNDAASYFFGQYAWLNPI